MISRHLYGAITLILMLSSLAFVATLALWTSWQLLLGAVLGFSAALAIGAWAVIPEDFE